MGVILINPIRYIQTLRYLRPVQIYSRIWFKIYQPRPDLRPAPLRRKGKHRAVGWAEHAPSMLGPEQFRFLNEEGGLDEGWNPPKRSRLWAYNLHYFDDLNAEEAPQRNEWHSALIRRWIQENRPGNGPGWEPYAMSLRVVNWIKWALGGGQEETKELEIWDLLIQSLAVQARFLERRLEYHLLGNHLLANAKALVFAGLFFEGTEAERWLGRGLRILSRELSEQVLSDGGHFERSPMYHAIVVEDLLDLFNMTMVYPQRLGLEHVSRWREMAGRMLKFLSIMSHPDDEIVLFNDAAFKIAASLGELFAYACRLGVSLTRDSQEGISYLKDSGYIRISKGPAIAFLDVAPLGPDYLMGHGHADTLTFELSLGGRRVIVDSGTSTYEPGADRARQRGTSAHNTVTVDRQNSSEVWGSFRVARRARPIGLSMDKAGGLITVRCSHDGYKRLPGRPIHSRKCCLGSTSFCVEDTVSGGFSVAVARFHFHPHFRAEALNEKEGEARLIDGRNVHWEISGGDGRLVKSTYHPMFGSSIENQCLEVFFRTSSVRTKFTW